MPQLFLFPFRPLAKVVGFLAKGYFLCLGPSLLFLLCFLESLDLLHLCLKLFYSHGTCRGFFFFTLNLPGERLFIFVEVALEVAELRQRAHKLKEFVFGFFQLIAEALACILPFFEPVRGLISCPRCLFALFQGALKLRQDRLPLPLKVFQLGILLALRLARLWRRWALLRWRSATFTVFSRAFWPSRAETGLVQPLGLWLLGAAFGLGGL